MKKESYTLRSVSILSKDLRLLDSRADYLLIQFRTKEDFDSYLIS